MIFKLILVLISFEATEAISCYDPSERLIGTTCFTLVNKPMNYYDAQHYCQYNSLTWSSLAVETSHNEMVFLTSFARGEFGQNFGYFWIGVLRQESYESFKTIYGTPLKYDNFKNINPTMNYGAARLADGSWDTRQLEEPLPFACSYVPLERKSTTVGYGSTPNWLRKSVDWKTQASWLNYLVNRQSWKWPFVLCGTWLDSWEWVIPEYEIIVKSQDFCWFSTKKTFLPTKLDSQGHSVKNNLRFVNKSFSAIYPCTSLTKSITEGERLRYISALFGTSKIGFRNLNFV